MKGEMAAKGNLEERPKSADEILRIVRLFPVVESERVLRGMTFMAGPFNHMCDSVQSPPSTLLLEFLEQVLAQL